MNIVFLVANLACGGVERTVSYLSEYFAINGHNTSIICISDEQFYNINEKVNLIKLNIPSYCKGKFDRCIKIAKRMIKIDRALRETKPDCVVCLDAEMIRFIRVQYKLRKFKLITSERTNPMMNSESQRKAKIEAYRKSDGIIFQTERARNCFPSDIANKGVVIPNAVGNKYVFNTSRPKERRQVITAAGRLVKQKDYPTLLKAFALFNKIHPDYCLEIYGSGEDKDLLVQMTDELGIAKNVHFMGVIKDAIIHIASSSCYVMSSIYEGMPNSLMEALAVGVPCISTNCPFGPAELIQNNINGILVDVSDFIALSRAMCKMIENREFAEECAEKGRRILNEQSISVISHRYLNYILEVVEKHHSSKDKGN